jgi:hypothetical protein
VKWLIDDGGAFDTSSTSRPDDPYSIVHYGSNEAIELVHFSVFEALYEAYEQVRPGPSHLAPPEVYAEILEFLLMHSGTIRSDRSSSSRDDLNVIGVYVVDRLTSHEWSDRFNYMGDMTTRFTGTWGFQTSRWMLRHLLSFPS